MLSNNNTKEAFQYEMASRTALRLLHASRIKVKDEYNLETAAFFVGLEKLDLSNSKLIAIKLYRALRKHVWYNPVTCGIIDFRQGHAQALAAFMSPLSMIRVTTFLELESRMNLSSDIDAAKCVMTYLGYTELVLEKPNGKL